MDSYKIKSGLFGVAVGDALGVPVEFKSREYLKKNPVTDMIGFGTHYQPPGTWSDDSSLTFLLADSLCTGFNLDDIGYKFCEWLNHGYWTPRGNVFDIGETTKEALLNLQKGCKAELAGSDDINSNGNGSLMRMLPLAYYLQNYNGDKFEIVHKVSAITHRHIRSQIACSIYVEFAINLLNGQNNIEAYESMQKNIMHYYSNKVPKKELNNFNRILAKKLYMLDEKEINSSGYVVDTLEASLWCFLNSKDFSSAVLKAVNLGLDTDTTGSVTGGIAGIYYGFNNIPCQWIESLPKRNNILVLSETLSKHLDKKTKPSVFEKVRKKLLKHFLMKKYY